jgi:hypothetical protein
MSAYSPNLPVNSDLLVAEAKQRARRRRVVLSVGVVAASVALFLALGGGPGSGRGQDGGATASRGGGDSGIGQLVSQSTTRTAYFVSGGGIAKPPGGAALRHKHKLVAQPTVRGPAAIWVAPDWAVRGTCAWLTIGRDVNGGECRRSPPPRGLWEVVPFHFQIKRQSLTLLWGHAGRDVTSLSVHFQDGTATKLSLTDGVFFRVFPKERWVVGHRPTWLVARGTDGRVTRVRLITNSRFPRSRGA